MAAGPRVRVQHSRTRVRAMTPESPTTRRRIAVRPMAARLRARRPRPPVRKTAAGAPTDPPAPALHLEDVSAIPFLSRASQASRSISTAPDSVTAAGDAYAAVTGVRGGLRRLLHAAPAPRPGDPHRGAGKPMPRRPTGRGRGLHDRRGAFERIDGHSRAASGRLVIHPYMAIEPIWQLARRIAERAGASGHRARAATAGHVAGERQGRSSTSSSMPSSVRAGRRRPGGGRRRSRHRRQPARRWPSKHHAAVGLKRTRCASAMGNAGLRQSTALRDRSRRRRVEQLVATVPGTRTEWVTGRESCLAVAWEGRPAASPSTQWWIPPAAAGLPRLDGIYEQILEGRRKVFVGSRPSTLPDSGQPPAGAGGRAGGRGAAGARLRRPLLVRPSRARRSRRRLPHPIHRMQRPLGRHQHAECSWVDRLVTRTRGARPPYRAQDVTRPGTWWERASKTCWSWRDRKSSTRCGEPAASSSTTSARWPGFGKFDVIALGGTQDAAERAVVETLPRLLARLTSSSSPGPVQ